MFPCGSISFFYGQELKFYVSVYIYIGKYLKKREKMNLESNEYINIPVLPLRDAVVYPYMVLPLFVAREKSIQCINAAMEQNKEVLLVAQKEADTEEPQIADLHTTGTIAKILQTLKMPDGSVKVLVEGQYRAKIYEFSSVNFFMAKAERLHSIKLEGHEEEVIIRSALSQFEAYVKRNKKDPIGCDFIDRKYY